MAHLNKLNNLLFSDLPKHFQLKTVLPLQLDSIHSAQTFIYMQSDQECQMLTNSSAYNFNLFGANMYQAIAINKCSK